MPVAAVTAASTVASVFSGDQPAAAQASTTDEAMADRKISPTSWTWPAGGHNSAALITTRAAQHHGAAWNGMAGPHCLHA